VATTMDHYVLIKSIKFKFKFIRVEKRNAKRRLADQAKNPWNILRRLNSKNVMTAVLTGAKSGAHSANLLFETFFPKSAVSGEKQKDFVEKLGEDLNKMDPVAKSFVGFTEKKLGMQLLV